MVDAKALRKLLEEQYGIRSDKELCEALKKNPKVNIGVCVSPVKRGSDELEKNRCIA